MSRVPPGASPSAGSSTERSLAAGRVWFLLSRGVLVTSFLTVAALSAEGCDCGDILNPIGDDAGVVEPACTLADGEDCASNEVLRQGQCVRSGCEADTDCCPGTRCRLDLNTCWPYQLDGDYACEDDADCPDPAQRCKSVTIGPRDPLPVCAFDRCQGDTDCGEGRTCFHSVCVQTAPCQGGCPDGEVCDVLTSQCHPAPAGAAGCSLECDGIKVLADPDLMAGEQCCPTVCQCLTLPPIVPRRFGRYASAALNGSELLVSAYDAEYGDLVVVSFKTDGSFSRIEYIDGVPAGGAQVADRAGPRGGVAEPGPNVGTHTAIATDASGRARIAYHDVDNRALKVAIQVPGGWNTYTLETPAGEGRVGTFNDVAVDPTTGTIYVSYLAHDVTGAPGIAGPATGLKVARSLVAEPTAATDWQLSWVDVREAFDACGGTCGPNQACVLEGGPSCRNTAPSCPDTCNGEEVSAQLDAPDADGNTSACFPPPLPPEPAGLPRGRGLHTSAVVDGGGALVAYYDRIDGQVRLARVGATGNPEIFILDGDGQNGHLDGDVGRFPSVAVVGSEVWVTYTDFARHQLRLWKGTPGQAGSVTTLDDGTVTTAPGLHFVGAGNKLAAGGQLVVYQDATDLDLKVASPAASGTGWTTETLLAEGAHGFYADVAVGDGTAFIVHVQAQLDPRGEERSRLGVLVRSLP